MSEYDVQVQRWKIIARQEVLKKWVDQYTGELERNLYAEDFDLAIAAHANRQAMRRELKRLQVLLLGSDKRFVSVPLDVAMVNGWIR